MTRISYKTLSISVQSKVTSLVPVCLAFFHSLQVCLKCILTITHLAFPLSMCLHSYVCVEESNCTCGSSL